MPLKDPEEYREYMREYRQRGKAPADAGDTLAHKIAGYEAADAFRQWAEDRLRVPNGLLAGESFIIDDWQFDFVADALGEGVREAGLSVARKNGKSGVIAALLLCFLVGPLNQPNWRGIVVSLTGLLAAELRDAMDEIIKASELEGVEILRTPTPGRATGRNGARLQFLAADKATGHAVGSDLVIIDEAGLLEENKRPLWNACYSSTSARDGRVICISIMGHGPMFKALQGRRSDDAVVWHEYSCEEGCDMTDPEEWHKGNPGLASGIKSLSYMQDAAARAAGSPQDALAFRTYDLNSPGNPSADVIVDVADWQRCVGDELPPATGPCYVGLDIGGARSFTGAAAYWPETNRLDVWAGVGGIPDLLQRGQGDGVGERYLAQRDRGELEVYEGWRETPVGPFLEHVGQRLQGMMVRGLAADRYKQAAVQDALEKAGMREWLNWVEWRGQGFKDGSEDVVAFQKAVYGGRIGVVRNLVMESAIMESSLTYDEAGNPKLDKRRQRGRIDALSAGVLAVAMGERYRRKPAEASFESEIVEPLI